MRITVTTSRQRARDVLAEELVRQLDAAKRAVELMSQDRERAERRENEARRALEGAERRILQESARRVVALEQAEQHAAQLVRVICEDAERIASHSDAIDRLLAALNSNEATYTCPAIDCYFVVRGTAATLTDWIAKHVNWTGHDVGMIQRRQPVTVSQGATCAVVGCWADATEDILTRMSNGEVASHHRCAQHAQDLRDTGYTVGEPS